MISSSSALPMIQPSQPFWTQPTNALREKTAPQWQSWWNRIAAPMQNNSKMNIAKFGDPVLASPTECMAAVKDLSYELCIASGGMNPNKPGGDSDHYHEDAWINFKDSPQGMGCKYCVAKGFWPQEDNTEELFEEDSLMIFCKFDAETDKVQPRLVEHCISTGIALSQDAVLYRGEEMTKVYELKTYPEPAAGYMVNWRALNNGAMGPPLVDQGFGTIFYDRDGTKDDKMFIFDEAMSTAYYCKNQCFINAKNIDARFCVEAGTGDGGRNGPCDTKCTPCVEFLSSNICCPKIN